MIDKVFLEKWWERFIWGEVIPEIYIENSFATPMYSEYMKNHRNLQQFL